MEIYIPVTTASGLRGKKENEGRNKVKSVSVIRIRSFLLPWT